MLVVLLSLMLRITHFTSLFFNIHLKAHCSIFLTNMVKSLSLPPSQGIIFHVIASKVVKFTIFISNSPFISLFAFLHQKHLNRKCSKLPYPPIYDTSVYFAVRGPITGLNSCGLLKDIGEPPSGTSFQTSTLICMSSRYQELNFVSSLIPRFTRPY